MLELRPHRRGQERTDGRGIERHAVERIAKPSRGASTTDASASQERVILSSPPWTVVERTTPGTRETRSARSAGSRLGVHTSNTRSRGSGADATLVGTTGTGATGRSDEVLGSDRDTEAMHAAPSTRPAIPTAARRTHRHRRPRTEPCPGPRPHVRLGETVMAAGPVVRRRRGARRARASCCAG